MTQTAPLDETRRAAGACVALADFSRRAPRLFDRLSQRTALQVAAATSTDWRYLLDYRDDRLCLVDTSRPSSKPFSVDFNRARRDGPGRDLLRRAVGRGPRSIIDATAGFGNDAMHLARAGCRVIAVERCAVIAVLFEDALRRLADAGLRRAVQLVSGDAADVLGLPADVVYLDPMYDTASRLKSLPRRAMILARDLAGDDGDAADTLALARAHCRRVVVKRPDKSPPLASGVHHAHRGRTVRFDVYLDTGQAKA